MAGRKGFAERNIRLLIEIEKDYIYLCELMNLHPEYPKRLSRKKEIVMARQIISWVLNKYKYTLELIGILFSQDHSTIINSVDKTEWDSSRRTIAYELLSKIQKHENIQNSFF